MNARPITVFFDGLFMDAAALRTAGFHPAKRGRLSSRAWRCRSAGARH
jgi:hypothetical protein